MIGFTSMRFLVQMGLFGLVRFLTKLVFERRLPVWVRLLPIITLVYILSPLDILPDFMGLRGRIDDFLVMVVALLLLFRFIPKQIFREYLGRHTKQETSEADKRVVEGSYHYIDEEPLK